MKKAFTPWEVPHARCDASIVTKAHAMTKNGKQNNPHLQATRVQRVQNSNGKKMCFAMLLTKPGLNSSSTDFPLNLGHVFVIFPYVL